MREVNRKMFVSEDRRQTGPAAHIQEDLPKKLSWGGCTVDTLGPWVLAKLPATVWMETLCAVVGYKGAEEVEVGDFEIVLSSFIRAPLSFRYVRYGSTG